METRHDDAPVLVIVGEGGDVRFMGMTLAERLKAQFAAAGVVPAGEEAPAGSAIAVRADALIAQPLVAALVARPGLALVDEDGAVLAVHAPAGEVRRALGALRSGKAEGFTARRPEELGADYWGALRKRERPHALRFRETRRKALEWRLFRSTYKGVTDLVTKYLWPRPAFVVTRWLAETSVTPNMVTTLSFLFVLLAFWLFLQGSYGWGLAAAWFMTFLDTVDGKLARVTLTSSTWGNYFDHGIDLIHPPFWYLAWGLGLERSGFSMDDGLWRAAIFAIFAGYVLQRVMEGLAIKWLGLEIHIWRPLDSFFRLITARRNPNLIILTVSALFGRPDIGFLAVAGWTVICLVLHGVQIVQAFAAKRRQGRLVSWMAGGEGA